MTTTHPADATIEADPKVPLVRITREFAAPPAKVFRAHTDPDLVRQWLGPDDLETEIVHYECRTGGSYRYLQRRGDEEYGFNGCFHLVRPADLIIQTFTFEGMPEAVALERMAFVDLGDGRTRLECTSLVDSFEGRDGFLASGMETGVQQGYRRLDALLVD